MAIDTASLGGSADARFRVVAHDGANTGQADSAAFAMAAKAPQVFIQSPADNTHIQYGQLINFNGAAFDAQDTLVADGGLVWQDALGNVIGTGALVSSDTLRVGVNVVTLTATNSAGESAVGSRDHRRRRRPEPRPARRWQSARRRWAGTWQPAARRCRAAA